MGKSKLIFAVVALFLLGYIENVYARNYNPRTGRFLQRDPKGIWGDLPNHGNGYTYVGNNPLNYTDLLGLEKKCTIVKIVVSERMILTNYIGHKTTFGGWNPSPTTAAVDPQVYKVYYNPNYKAYAKKFKENDCQWNEFEFLKQVKSPEGFTYYTIRDRRIAEDTGGDVSGEHLDIWFPTKKEGADWIKEMAEGTPAMNKYPIGVYLCEDPELTKKYCCEDKSKPKKKK